MKHMGKQKLLGKNSPYPDKYDAGLLQGIPRAEARDQLMISDRNLPFTGVDIWTAYELSWLEGGGKPVCAMAELGIPANSMAIVESKSLKYYLNSLNQTAFENKDSVQQTIVQDLSFVAQAPVTVSLRGPDAFFASPSLQGHCIDSCELIHPCYQPRAELLSVNVEQKAAETLYSNLLKTNCPVTGQPDWASIWIVYEGNKIVEASLLAYIVSYRHHQGFHENCVERIFVEILEKCAPESLTVYARYTRRGGLDINPFRTNCAMALPNIRAPRQ